MSSPELILPPSPRGRVLRALALLALTLAGLGLRLWGIGFLLPHDLEGDARLLFQMRVLHGVDPEGAHNEHFGQYPLLIAYLEYCLPGLDPQQAASRPPAESREEHLERAGELALRGRRLTACLASLLIPATYWLTRRFQGRWTAFLAAAFVAVSPLHLNYSQQSRPHAVSAVFVILALLAAMALARKGSLGRWALHGLGAALALGALQSGIALLFPWLLALLARMRRDGRAAWPGALLSLGFVASAIPVFYPFLFWRAEGARSAQLEIDGTHILMSEHVIQLESFLGSGFARLLDIFWNYEPWLLLGLLGFGLSFLSRLRSMRKQALSSDLYLALAYFLPYALVLGLYDRTVARFCTPLLPCAALLASLFLTRIGQRINRPSRSWLAPMPALLALGAAAATGMRQSYLRTQPDTQSEAAAWIRSNLDPANDRIATFQRVFLPLFRRDGKTNDSSPRLPMQWDAYEQAEREHAPEAERWKLWSFSSATLKQRRTAQEDPGLFYSRIPGEIVVLQTMREPPVGAWHNRLVESVRNSAELLVRISPDSDPATTDAYFHYDDPQRFVDAPHRTLRLWRARCFGPVVEIYRFRR